MALEEQFEITLDEEGACSRQAQLLSQRGTVSRVLTPRASPGAEKITTVQEAADLIQSQMK